MSEVLARWVKPALHTYEGTAFAELAQPSDSWVTLVDTLPQEERNTIYTMIDAFVGKRKLKFALQNVLQEAN
jgi:hypothetical protein